MQRSKIAKLPEDVRGWLDTTLIGSSFAGYDALADALAERGWAISKSAVHRYGQDLERRLSAIKTSTEAARLIAAHAPDDEDDRSAAVISIIQTDVFEMLVALQEAEDADPQDRVKLLARVAKAIAELSRASVNQKKWRTQVRERVEAAARAAERLAKKGGLSADSVAEIRSAILGIAQ